MGWRRKTSRRRTWSPQQSCGSASAASSNGRSSWTGLLLFYIYHLLFVKYLLLKHFLRVLVVVAVFMTSDLTAQKPTMETVGVSVAGWGGLERK